MDGGLCEAIEPVCVAMVDDTRLETDGSKADGFVAEYIVEYTSVVVGSTVLMPVAIGTVVEAPDIAEEYITEDTYSSAVVDVAVTELICT